MKHIPAFITVRTKSSRLPEKCFLPFGKVTVLEHVIDRCIFYKLEPIICTTVLASDDRIVELALSKNVKVFRGSSINKLERWRDCCREYNLNSFHSVDADDPFFCGEEVRRSYSTLLDGGFDMVSPSPSSSQGGATVGYSLTKDIIEKACKDLSTDTDTEMMWSFLERVKGINKAELSDPEHFAITQRMTLDYNEDYILLKAIRLILGQNPSRKDIYLLHKNNPNLSDINNFRNEEWAENQKNKMFKEL